MSYQLINNLFKGRPQEKSSMKRNQTLGVGAPIPLIFTHDKNEVNTSHNSS